MDLPTVENGGFKELHKDYKELPFKIGTTLHAFCKTGYSRSDNMTITCIENGTWHPSHIHCKAFDEKISYFAILFVCLASVVIIIIVLMTIVIILHRKSRKCQKIPKWTRNYEERRQKSSSELVEKIYKELVEKRHGIKSFHQFSAAQSWPHKREHMLLKTESSPEPEKLTMHKYYKKNTTEKVSNEQYKSQPIYSNIRQNTDKTTNVNVRKLSDQKQKSTKKFIHNYENRPIQFK